MFGGSRKLFECLELDTGDREGDCSSLVSIGLCTTMQELDQGRVVFLVLLGHIAAFDLVDHDFFLQRRDASFGVRGLALEWIRSFLKDSMQFVRIDGEVCDSCHLLSGAPQRSVIGRKPFSIFTTPLGQSLFERVFKQKRFDQLFCSTFCLLAMSRTG